MASGIKVDDEVKQTFQQISLTTTKSTKLQYAIFRFSDDCKRIIVAESGSSKRYEDVISSLPPDDVRYCIYDFEYINKDNCKKSDMILISWHPQDCTVRKKMICASSLNALKSALCFARNILEGDTYSEVGVDAALEKVGGKAVPT